MFFLSGICIVASSTLVIIQNLDWLLASTERLGSRAAGWLPSIRLAISYPGANKGRTGMTIAMFSLIVFSLIVVSVITENFSEAFLSDKATAGWDFEVETTATNPVDNLTEKLEAEGYDTSTIASVGLLTTRTRRRRRNSGTQVTTTGRAALSRWPTPAISKTPS